MKRDVALRVLGDIMAWDDEAARKEFAWLNLMSRMKYDGYRDFLAGVRFVESLVDWLQQFDPSERRAAYAFVRSHLVYVGPSEMQHLVDLVYPENVRRRLASAVAARAGIPTHLLWARPDGVQRFRSLLRRTLFLGLSDGARIDGFRRVNVGLISNEQVVMGSQLDREKWDSLLDELRKDEQDPTAQFEFAYLIDDFVGSGKTLFRKKSSGGWTGKLWKFRTHIRDVRTTHFAPQLTVCVHHYIASHAASLNVVQRRDEATAELGDQWFPRNSLHFSFGTVLPADLPVDDARFGEFMKLVQKYYDPAVESRHTDIGETPDVRLGFGNCALPLILEHNTPNNSVALLWADTDGLNGQHAMRPLFRRRQRHV
jgi:hypothetical protein